MQVAAGVVAVGTMLWIILMWALLFVLRTRCRCCETCCFFNSAVKLEL